MSKLNDRQLVVKDHMRDFLFDGPLSIVLEYMRPTYFKCYYCNQKVEWYIDGCVRDALFLNDFSQSIPNDIVECKRCGNWICGNCSQLFNEHKTGTKIDIVIQDGYCFKCWEKSANSHYRDGWNFRRTQCRHLKCFVECRICMPFHKKDYFEQHLLLT